MKDQATLKLVWESLVKAIEAFNYGMDIPPSAYTREAIDNSNVELAEKLIRSYGL